jgi:hypothetical protein
MSSLPISCSGLDKLIKVVLSLLKIKENTMKPEFTERFDLVHSIMDYESGEQDERDTLILFSHLISTGDAWRLQGSYGRAAAELIDRNIIDKLGNVNWELYDSL